MSDTLEGLDQSSALFYHRAGSNSEGQPETFHQASALSGRYVRLRRVLPDASYLCLLELEVYGGKAIEIHTLICLSVFYQDAWLYN